MSSPERYNFVVSKEDWSLHRKGYQDQQRHQEKVREVIRQNLPDLVTEENIIMSDGKQIIKVPLRNLEEYRFIHNYQKQKHVGQGDGSSEVGDVLGQDSPKDNGKGGKAGDRPGIDYVEADISIEELEDMLFEELELPFIQEKDKDELETESYRFNDIRKKGLMSNIDKKRTILENLRRNATAGTPGIHGITPDDLRYKTWEEVVIPHSNAVIIAMMDTSGSMGAFEKYCARSFFFWMTRFLRRQYEKVEIVFLAHHTEAKEVSEEEFFTRGESGGTICSSVYQKALEIIDSRYPPSSYNIYPFHFSDGDNLTSDNERCTKLIVELMKRCNLFGYGEVNQYNRGSTLMSAYRNIKQEKFMYYVIKEKGEVYNALKRFFHKREGGAAS
ncbi:MAG: sporulation protein YhbH [Paenibacillus macerans]|uniref:Sporulation protein YhbH n=3 Tax=Paenibacillus TaxID=44249 RepID=A0A090Y393_PAEMA|nr:sporulation protein YhbH [Paenibacillus macerans]KFM92904.1 sporulation protein YhbH [Paenibacillus macerans]MBS5913430.1 sporulation protein YhbH [Paenibacillus macerans]MDU7476160.1 sporulation protein YhbH [Paenibacillus macerans]MEC0141263.1 sporulation protein YhbH [Paenibacillus macerans]MEC0154532.1 sporulation protein YhbH [Paenibacillus macerans]